MSKRLDQIVAVIGVAIVVSGVAAGIGWAYSSSQPHPRSASHFVHGTTRLTTAPAADSNVVPSYLPTGFSLIGRDSLPNGATSVTYGVPGQRSTPVSIPASISITTIGGPVDPPPADGGGVQASSTTVRGHAGYLMIDPPSGSLLLSWSETPNLTVQLAGVGVSQAQLLQVAQGLVIS